MNRPGGALQVVLLSTYDLGRQPFGIASPARWLSDEGCEVTCQDLAVEELDGNRIQKADLIGLFLPMHTATILATRLMERLHRLNPTACIACYGLYAPLNEAHLRGLGAAAILGGEFESGLVSLARRLMAGEAPSRKEPSISLARQEFRLPLRSGLPAPDHYAKLQVGDDARLAGSTQASRGCKHRCRHCPVVPVYQGRFRIVAADVVIEDVRQQVASGVRHITFGDPDFFNAPAHALPLLASLHAEWPELTFDVTIKVEHLLLHRDRLAELRASGCILVTTAVESLDDRVLLLLDKGHTREDFFAVVPLLRDAGMTINPTFIPFTQWTTPADYRELLDAVEKLGLVEHVSPIQYAIRMLIPPFSALLDLEEVRNRVEPLDPATLAHPWQHPDPAMDRLHVEVVDWVEKAGRRGAGRRAIFSGVCRLAGISRREEPTVSESASQADARPARVAIPYLTEPWYC